MKNTATKHSILAFNITENSTNIFIALISLTVYIYLLFPFLSWFAWLLPSDLLSFTPKYNMDSACFEDQIVYAIIFDLPLIAAFAIPHNILARTCIKEKLGFPISLERSFFVLQAPIFLRIQLTFWKNFEGPVLWDIAGRRQYSRVLMSLYTFGVIFLLSSPFALPSLWIDTGLWTRS